MTQLNLCLNPLPLRPLGGDRFAHAAGVQSLKPGDSNGLGSLSPCGWRGSECRGALCGLLSVRKGEGVLGQSARVC